MGCQFLFVSSSAQHRTATPKQQHLQLIDCTEASTASDSADGIFTRFVPRRTAVSDSVRGVLIVADSVVVFVDPLFGSNPFALLAPFMDRAITAHCLRLKLPQTSRSLRPVCPEKGVVISALVCDALTVADFAISSGLFWSVDPDLVVLPASKQTARMRGISRTSSSFVWSPPFLCVTHAPSRSGPWRRGLPRDHPCIPPCNAAALVRMLPCRCNRLRAAVFSVLVLDYQIYATRFVNEFAKTTSVVTSPHSPNCSDTIDEMIPILVSRPDFGMDLPKKIFTERFHLV